MLDTDHADTAFAAHNRHAGKGVELVLPVSGRYEKSGCAVASARLSVSAREAMVPTSPSPIAMRVTWTASCAKPRVAKVRASLRAADRSSRPRCAGFRRSLRPRCSIWPVHDCVTPSLRADASEWCARPPPRWNSKSGQGVQWSCIGVRPNAGFCKCARLFLRRLVQNQVHRHSAKTRPGAKDRIGSIVVWVGWVSGVSRGLPAHRCCAEMLRQ
jgi:hypothetical protein